MPRPAGAGPYLAEPCRAPPRRAIGQPATPVVFSSPSSASADQNSSRWLYRWRKAFSSRFIWRSKRLPLLGVGAGLLSREVTEARAGAERSGRHPGPHPEVGLVLVGMHDRDLHRPDEHGRLHQPVAAGRLGVVPQEVRVQRVGGVGGHFDHLLGHQGAPLLPDGAQLGGHHLDLGHGPGLAHSDHSPFSTATITALHTAAETFPATLGSRPGTRSSESIFGGVGGKVGDLSSHLADERPAELLEQVERDAVRVADHIGGLEDRSVGRDQRRPGQALVHSATSRASASSRTLKVPNSGRHSPTPTLPPASTSATRLSTENWFFT